MGAQYKIMQVPSMQKLRMVKGAKIKFPKISVGSTENLMIAACLAKGQTTLSNCAIEPEIKDLSNFLNSIGAKIEWTGKRQIKIIGVKTFKQSNYKIMFDRIEAGTYLIAAAVTYGDILKSQELTQKLLAQKLIF